MSLLKSVKIDGVVRRVRPVGLPKGEWQTYVVCDHNDNAVSSIELPYADFERCNTGSHIVEVVR